MMSNQKKLRIIIPVIILLAAASAWLWWPEKTFYCTGTIEATEVTLSARVTSTLAALAVQEGDEVHTDQVLVTLSGEDLKLKAARSQREFERGQKLYRSGSLPASDLDNLRFQRDHSALLVDWCTVVAPGNGVVLHTYREPGELVTPGTPLLTIGDLDTVWAYLYVEQPMLVHLQVGQKVNGFLPEWEKSTFTGIIRVIKDEAEFTPKNVQTRQERTRLVYGVKVEFDNQQRLLKPGMMIEVRLPERLP